MKDQKAGPFATLFFWIGAVAGGAAGAEAGDFMGMLIGAALLGAIGYGIGRQIDVFVVRLIFVAISIISILVNSAIRRLLWEVIRAAFNS